MQLHFKTYIYVRLHCEGIWSILTMALYFRDTLTQKMVYLNEWKIDQILRK